MIDADPALSQAKAATQALLVAAVAAAAPAGSDVAARATGCWALVHGLAVLLQDGLIVEGSGVHVEGLVERVVGSLL